MKMVGDRGKWQFRVFLFTWLEGILIGFHHLASAFLGFVPEHHCDFNHLNFPSDWTEIQRKNFSIPVDDNGEYSKCEMYDIGASSISGDFDSAILGRTAGKVACESWDYATNMGHTIVSEWDLVCDRTALLSTVQGSYMGGVFVGCLFWGWASDKFGRRPSILVSVGIQIVSSVVAAFSVNYVMFIFFRFIIAFSVSGVFECAFVLVMEIVSPELRTPFGIMTQFPFGLGVCILPAIAYFFRDWMPLQLAISIPCVVLLSYFIEIPESPRWLVQKKRFVEAKDIIKRIAKGNGNEITITEEELLKTLENLDDTEKETETENAKAPTTSENLKAAVQEVAILFETPQLRKRTLNIFFSWLVVAMVYYGLSLNSKNIGGDIYLSMFISGMAEVLACLAIIPALARFGRVKIYSGGFILGGICCLTVAVILFVVPKDTLVGLVITIAMTGKFLISGTFALSYLYTAELFPTPVRNVAVGGASTFARVGSASAPYIVDILGRISAGIPAVIFGAFSVIAGLLALLLPETLNKELPETVADVENWNKSEKQINNKDES